MDLSPVSLLALAIIAGSLAVAYSGRFLAWGSLMVANIAVFLLTIFGGVRQGMAGADAAGALETYPTIHAELGMHVPQLLELQPQALLTMVSHMFVHWNIWHLVGNMVTLFAFGMPFEERIGHRRFVTIYLVTGLGAALAQTAFSAGSNDVLMGASGAIFGILGAFAARFPNQVIGVPLPLLIIMVFVRMRVIIGALIYAALETARTIFAATGAGSLVSNTAHAAHIGGLAVGVVLGRTVVQPATTQGPIAVDLALLKPFARDQATRDVLAHMERNHDVPEAFQAWLDRFFRGATCPTCGHKVVPRAKGEVVCTQNHRFDVRKGKPAAA